MKKEENEYDNLNKTKKNKKKGRRNREKHGESKHQKADDNSKKNSKLGVKIN